MRNTLKKALAAALAVLICLSFAGCYSENNSWAAKKGDETLPIGSYIFYMSNAVSDAAAKVPSDQETLKATIDGKDASSWIRERAADYLKSYYYIADKYDALGLGLTSEDEASLASNTDAIWSYYSSTFESMGVAKESLHLASSVYNLKYQEVMNAMYKEGGELAIPDAEMKSYYSDNYYSYEYFTVSYTRTDDDGNSVAMTDEEKEAAQKEVDAYVKQINDGTLSVSEAASEYAEKNIGSTENSTYQSPSPLKSDYISSTILDALKGAEENVAVTTEDGTRCYVIRKLSISDAYDEMKSDESQLSNLIYDMKDEEFADYVMEQAAKMEGVEINQRALNTVKISKFISDSTKNGTSSAESAGE